MSPENPPGDEVRASAALAAGDAIRPIVAAVLAAGVSAETFLGLVRMAFLQAAENKLRASGHRPSVSRVAAATGMTRNEVRHLLAQRANPASSTTWAPNASDRIIAGWTSDPDFLLPDGAPRPLSYVDTGLSFPELARRYSRGIPPRAMLNELLDGRRIRDMGDGTYCPSDPQPSHLTSPQERYLAFGAKLHALGSTLARNLESTESATLFETYILSEGLPEIELPKTMRDLNRRCRTFSEAIERYLMDQGSQINNTRSDTSQRAVGVLVAIVDRLEEQGADISDGSESP